MKSKSSVSSKWSSKPGIWFSILSIVALLWNIGGGLQFINSITASEASMQGAMMTPEQIRVITSIPFWVTFVFGVGVVTSLLGSVFLYLRHGWAKLTLVVSFLAFVVLSLAYVIYGVFAAIGTQQVVVMTIVVVVAFALVLMSRLIRSTKGANKM
jgi:hypothetical protein